MRQRTVHRWLWLHKWSSLICTLFLLMACITGLPLILKDEIADWLEEEPPSATLSATTAPVTSLDTIVARSLQMFPGEIVTSIFLDDDAPEAMVWMAASWVAINADRNARHWIMFDTRTAEVVKLPSPSTAQRFSFMGVMLELHKDLFAGLPGELFMGLMGLLFVVAIVSGVVIYRPFMRKLAFGTVRTKRSPRVKWLDLHNLMGIVTLAWALVVGATGVINELSTPLVGLWLLTDVKPAVQSLNAKGQPPVKALSSVQQAMERAEAALPGMDITMITFPGAELGTPWHYVFSAKGHGTLSSRLLSFAVIDARDGSFHSVVQMPWYLRVLEISRPLHFGDYGGLPLKVIWLLLDLVTIIVLCSGLYLWAGRVRSPRRRRAAALGDAAATLASPAE